MTHGVTVTQQILVLLFEVRILVGQLIIQYTDYATVRRGGERQMTYMFFFKTGRDGGIGRRTGL